MPTPRLLTVILAVLASTLWGATAVTAESDPAKPAGAGVPPQIEFFLARSETNACGPGCNEWIAAEGKIDAGAASRLRRLLTKLGRRRLPIFFHSPGGSVAGSIELGRLIRDQKLETSVAHTIPLGCDREKLLEKSCEAQKRSGQELESEIDPVVAMCNSGCVYAVAGGAVRRIPPGVKLAIHDVGLDPATAPARGALVSAGKKLAHERIQEYLRDMGIEEALYKAAVAIPFESSRFLEREELARFGLDRRELGETPWQFIDKPTPAMRKRIFLRTDQARYVDGSLNLGCGTGQAIRLVLAWQHDASEAAVTGPRLAGISLSGQRLDLSNTYAAKDFDIRFASLTASTFDTVDDNATIGLSTEPARPDALATLNMHGFSVAYAKLRKSCDERARNTIAVASPAAPSVTVALPAKPAQPIPYLDAGLLAKLSQPAVQVRTGSQNTPAAPPTTEPDPPQLASNTPDPPTQPDPVQESCNLHIAGEPQHLTGRVTRFLSGEEILARTQSVEDRLGAKISPAYASLKRVTVESYPQDGNGSTMAAIPERMAVKIGDLVELNSRHQDESLRCHFIPWTINRIVGHVE